MVRIACTLMQKNEEILLESWILYHGYLFGFENLYIYDNGSSVESVRQTLQRFQKVGVNVHWDKTSSNDFKMKGVIVGDLIRKFRRDDAYDIVFPMDFDEFIAISGERGLSTSRAEIVSYLESIKDTRDVPDMLFSFTNWPGHLDLFVAEKWNKGIIPVRYFKDIDHGFHVGNIDPPNQRFRSKIIYYHMHHKPISYIRRNALEKLRPFVDVEDLEAISKHEGVGIHLKRYFVMNEETYCDTVRNKFPLVRTRALADQMEAFGVLNNVQKEWSVSQSLYQEKIGAQPVIDLDAFYDRTRYLKSNRDLDENGIDPLVHYIRNGYLEGRKIL